MAFDNGMGAADIQAITGGGYRNNGLGDDLWILVLFLLFCNNGWGGFGFGGGNMGGFAADGAMLYPWMNQAELTSNGFRDQMINNNITSVRDGISDVANQLCNGFAGVNATVNAGFAGAEQSANARQMANMSQAFAMQTAMNQGFNQIGSQFADCCCENRLGLADLKYTVATENCADRTQSMQNTRDILENQNRNTQAVIDKLCALELDGVKGQLAQAERENDRLRDQLNVATTQNNMNTEVDALYNRLKNCPVPTMPVYGNTPIFTCNNNGCGCGVA